MEANNRTNFPLVKWTLINMWGSVVLNRTYERERGAFIAAASTRLKECVNSDNSPIVYTGNTLRL